MHSKSPALVFAVAVVIGVLASRALPKAPDLSGTWVLEREDPIQVEGRASGSGAATVGLGSTITIVQTRDSLIITPDGGATATYPFDNRETTFTRATGETITSRTRWEGPAAVTDTCRQSPAANGIAAVRTRESRSLGQDGSTLTIRVTIEAPGRSLTRTLIFRKQTAGVERRQLQASYA